MVAHGWCGVRFQFQATVFMGPRFREDDSMKGCA
jgi:hypothetical protein